ncbi:MAG: LemA family protein [Patescibacteria group bacterium]|nr:LemA family protein [Patescibacteria group bacterium]
MQKIKVDPVSFLLILLSGMSIVVFSGRLSGDEFIVFGIIVIILSIYFYFLYLRHEKIVFRIDSIPLLQTDEAVSGVPFSCEGKITPEDKGILISPYAKKECIYYHSITEKKETAGVAESLWIVVEDLIDFRPFYVQDDRGKLKVDITNVDVDTSEFSIRPTNKHVPDPDHSEIDATPLLVRQKYNKSENFELIASTVHYRRSEFALLPNTNVFVCGYVSKVNDELVLHEHKDYPLIISRKTKERYIQEFYKGSNILYFSHLFASIGFITFMISFDYVFNIPSYMFIFIVLLGNLIIMASLIVAIYNRMITLKERAKTAASNIEIELKRRANLIPLIVEIVQKYAGIEKNIFETLLSLKIQMVSEFSQINNTFQVQSKNVLFALLEKYPDLLSVKNYKELMNLLVDTEERIAYQRAFYNRSVLKLNTLISQVPFCFIARMFRIHPMKYVALLVS